MTSMPCSIIAGSLPCATSRWSGVLVEHQRGAGFDLLGVRDDRQLREVLEVMLHLALLAPRKLEAHRCIPGDHIEDQVVFLGRVVDALDGPEDTSTMLLLVDGLGGCENTLPPAINGQSRAFWMS